MKINELSTKRVCIVGFAEEGKATLDALITFAPGAHITIADAKRTDTGGSYPTLTGPGYLSSLSDFDAIIKTPGVPMGPELLSVRDRVTSASQIFLDSVADTGAIVVGVTGTKGKSTTSALIAAILTDGGVQAPLVGNIGRPYGRPALSALGEARPGCVFVHEFSSQQLEFVTRSPQVAVLTSFFPDHLDFHKEPTAYWNAKANITRFQRIADYVFFNDEYAECVAMAALSPGTHVPFNRRVSPVTVRETQLRGDHNGSNLAAAALVGRHFEVPETSILKSIRGFAGLAHRLETVSTAGGIEWVSDPLSTTPESTCEGIRSFGDRLQTLIVGGKDRGYDFSCLGPAVVESRVTCVVLLPGSGDLIGAAIQAMLDARPRPLSLVHAATMDEAVAVAAANTNPGRVCLLSPASPSQNMFENYVHKARAFREAIDRHRAKHS